MVQSKDILSKIIYLIKFMIYYIKITIVKKIKNCKILHGTQIFSYNFMN